jgi:hypothetical protein
LRTPSEPREGTVAGSHLLAEERQNKAFRESEQRVYHGDLGLISVLELSVVLPSFTSHHRAEVLPMPLFIVFQLSGHHGG